MSTEFKLDAFNERENAVAQLMACVLLEETDGDYFNSAKDALNLSDDQVETIEQLVKSLEQKIADSDSSLSDLLANTAKSACCS